MTTRTLSDEPRGHTRLWVVFWIYGVLVSHLAFGAILLTWRQLGTPLAALLGGFVPTPPGSCARCG